MKIGFLQQHNTADTRSNVLRLAEGKEYARIYDFITLPRRPDTVASHTDEDTRYDLSLVRSELRRMYEFKRLAENPYDSDELVWQLREAYGFVDDIADGEDGTSVDTV